MKIVPLKPHEIDLYWNECKPIIQRAFNCKVNENTVDDYYPAIKVGELQLWVVLDKKLIGCIVTSVDQGSGDRVLNILSLAGDDFKKWVKLADEVLTEFATEKRCIALGYIGRRGFSILVPEYEEDGMSYVKMIGVENVKS